MSNTNQVNATEELQRLLIDTITSTRDGLAKGVDFAMEQIPEVCAQLLAWKFAEAALFGTCGIIAVLFLLTVWGIMFFKRWECDDDKTISRIASSVVCGIVIPCIIFAEVAPRVATCVKIKVAPKVYLVEFAAGMVKGGGGQ
jgi:hypothetical protein